MWLEVMFAWIFICNGYNVIFWREVGFLLFFFSWSSFLQFKIFTMFKSQFVKSKQRWTNKMFPFSVESLIHFLRTVVLCASSLFTFLCSTSGQGSKATEHKPSDAFGCLHWSCALQVCWESPGQFIQFNYFATSGYDWYYLIVRA